jgi:hypothetical protein
MKEDKELGCLEDVCGNIVEEPPHRIYEGYIPHCFDSRDCFYKIGLPKNDGGYNVCLYEFREEK